MDTWRVCSPHSQALGFKNSSSGDSRNESKSDSTN
jgi:hypothetical protein